MGPKTHWNNTGAVAEDGTLTATGSLATSDADGADTPAFTAQTNTAGNYGTFSVTTAGAWTYSLNNTAAQVLAGSQTVSETFTVTSTTADGESVNETVTVTVSGSEDAPVVTGTTSGAVAEDGTLTATGSLATSDADGADTPSFTAQTDTAGTYHVLRNAAGAWTYSLNNTAAQVLADGATVDDVHSHQQRQTVNPSTKRSRLPSPVLKMNRLSLEQRLGQSQKTARSPPLARWQHRMQTEQIHPRLPHRPTLPARMEHSQ